MSTVGPEFAISKCTSIISEDKELRTTAILFCELSVHVLAQKFSLDFCLFSLFKTSCAASCKYFIQTDLTYWEYTTNPLTIRTL